MDNIDLTGHKVFMACIPLAALVFAFWLPQFIASQVESGMVNEAARTAMCESMCATDKAGCYKYFAEVR